VSAARRVKLTGITWQGPAPDDPDLLDALPGELRDLLERTGGVVLLGGALHVRGACREPAWHALREVWSGPRRLADRYPAVRPADVPFAQDFLGDQLLLREGRVHKLWAETGALEDLGADLLAYLARVQEEPVATLGLEPFLRFVQERGRLEPGALLMAWPPFCSQEAEQGVAFKEVPVLERLDFLAELAEKVRRTGEGGRIRVALDG